MSCDRRQFLKVLGGVSATAAASAAAPVEASHLVEPSAGSLGVLVDTTLCVGCRHCEYACRKANGIEPGTLESYDDTTVFQQQRRPEPEAFTVINRWEPESLGEPVHAKLNCMHCNQPACVSACIVGALEKQDNGAVTYDAWKCIGCRYCMVACPFQLPAYEYHEAFTPRIRKCQFCFDRLEAGQLPGCVEGCPREALLFGRRVDLLEVAHQRIAAHPQRYVDHIYGEHEVGGTAWMYLASTSFDQLGFLKLGDKAPSQLTEAIQHGVFKHWIAPIALYGFLSASMYATRTRKVAELEAPGRRGLGKATDAPATETPDCAGEPVAAVAVATGNGELHTTSARAAGPVHAPAHVQAHAHAPAHAHAASHAHEHGHAAPVDRPLLTPGFLGLALVVLTGVGFGLYRFLFGLEAATNLDQQHPWGLWIAMDVGSGIALAGGGFMTAALVHIFHRHHYHAIARSALLTALLGYTFYVPGLLADLGRWYNLWHPMLPNMWQVNSVLFEVGICVIIYLNVQYAELAPIICERLLNGNLRWAWLARPLTLAHRWLERIMPALLVLGVTLSCFHQSSLGNLMVIAPYKLHVLWWSPLSPVMFLLSAMMVGFPMVIFTILLASWSLRRQPEMHVLAPLARYPMVFLALYLALKLGDATWRGIWPVALQGTLVSWSWCAELTLGVALPLVLLSQRRLRQSPRWLGAACLAVILGVVLNRINVFWIGYHPPFAQQTYFPTVTEVAVSAGLVAALMLVYRVAVTYLPILEPRPEVQS